MSDLIPWDLVLPPIGAPISWIREEDVIAGTAAAECDPGNVRLSLGTSNDHVRWWKALRVVAGNGNGEPDEGRVLGTTEFQDDVRNGPTLELPLADLAGSFVQFGKAKMFGIHTYMYHLPFDARPAGAQVPGAHLSFDWFRDNGVDNP